MPDFPGNPKPFGCLCFFHLIAEYYHFVALKLPSKFQKSPYFSFIGAAFVEAETNLYENCLMEKHRKDCSRYDRNFSTVWTLFMLTVLESEL
ncbi:MAG: hypothetical protein WCP55_08290 [Lentisphaerota bacterium]